MVTIMVPLNQTASFTFLDIFMIIAKILSPSTVLCVMISLSWSGRVIRFFKCFIY
jgi:hypothetical protein